ncbi:MAG: CARDB domain-containing protein, partial [Candidatus Krumholzibacteriia bacterium]
MRILLRTAMAACLGLTLATAAFATQGPPVKVRLLGEPRGVEPGESFKGTLEILVGRSADLTDFRFEGPGWRVRELSVPRQMFLDKDGRLEIPFEIEALDGAGELLFQFEFEGATVTKELDLTRAHHERMRDGAPTREAAPGPDPERNPDLQPAPAPADDPADKGAGEPDPEDQGGADKRTINVNGRFVYQRSDGVTIGADGVAVRVYDSDTFSDDHLGTTTTDAFGYYSININTDNAGENNPDLYVAFEAANSKVEVEDATWEINYSWETGVWDNFSGSTLNVGWREPSNESEHPALHILTDITRTWRWLMSHEGYDTPATDVQWPDGDSGAWYNSFWEEIHVGRNRQWNEATHSHEYMHHWVNKYATAVSPDYCNGICDTDGCGHCIWCWETDHDAFAEGFPNWVADVLTRSYAGDYGIASLNFRDQEDLNTCSADGTWDDPYITEGFFGALLRDIEDSGNDDHARYPGFADVMNAGTNEIFDVIDFDHPTTPAQFLLDFRDRFPGLKEALWETGMNCGYNFDGAAPGPVANLTSSSHSTSGDSPDPTVRYTWTRAADDASGIAGYGLYIAASAGMPGATQDIGDVTSYTTPVLAPGTYYFNIRAVDRDGNWSSSYRSYGPVTIRTPEPSDLTAYTPTGWTYPLVPRDDATATGSSATVSATLPGNTTGTYWNVRGINQGESGTSVGFQTRLYVDDVYRWWAGWASIGAGGSFYGTNLGPLSVPGGRHTLEARYDATEQVAETDETNNRYGRQFIWTPYVLSPGAPIVRGAPAGGQAGWDAVGGGGLWYNCDGLRTGNPGWWTAVYVRATANSDNYEARLHAASTGAENGFATNLGYSGRPAGYLDAVLINRNVASGSSWDVGVLNNSGSTGSYEAVQTNSTSFLFGDSLTVAMAENDFMDLHEFYVSADNAGFVSVTVDTDPDAGPLTVRWLARTFETGSLSSSAAMDLTDSGTGRARLDIEIPDAGHNCLVIHRDPRDGGSALDYTLEIQRTPPDFRPLAAAGWHAPIVPRPAHDGTAGSVALPDTLHGGAPTTYLNFALRNDSPTGSPDGLLVRAYIDGVYRAWLSYGAFGGNLNSLFNWDHAWNIAGGRHTLDMRCDPLQEIEEIHETNNTYGEQYVWSPLPLAAGTAVARNTPPDRTGGWDEVASAEPLWFNCDGLRLPRNGSWWQAMAVMPAAGADVDVRLHPLLAGTKNGFGTNVVTSSWGLESSDYVLVNYSVAPLTGMDAGVLNWGGGGGYTAEHAVEVHRGANPVGTVGDLALESGRILDLHEIYLDPLVLPNGIFTVRLDEVSGNVDWGITLHRADTGYQNKSTVVTDGIAHTGLPGAGEAFSVTVPVAGYYCLAVWKSKSDDLLKHGSYTLTFSSAVSSVGDLP